MQCCAVLDGRWILQVSRYPGEGGWTIDNGYDATLSSRCLSLYIPGVIFLIVYNSVPAPLFFLKMGLCGSWEKKKKGEGERSDRKAIRKALGRTG